MLLRFLLSLLLLSFSLILLAQKKSPSDIDFSKVKSDEIIIKLKPSASIPPGNQRVVADPNIRSLAVSTAFKPITNKKLSEKSVLYGVYKVKLEPGENVKEKLEEVQKYSNVQYAAPVFLEEILHIPSDTLADPISGSQAYLGVIKAYEAWDISKGRSDIIIGISDTGIDFTHEDIASKIYTNPNEIVNGVDDDGNGYIDDIHGYDIADEDNDAQCYVSFHGNRVAGLAGAATDNVTGIAGVGYNSTLSPIKVFKDGANFSTNPYESLIYAADNGYDVINLSWGSASYYVQFYQDMIDYAVLEHNVIVVAAGGNSGADEAFFPASYNHVLNVGFTDINDNKAGGATYSYEIDLVAPGQGILSTFKDNGYSSDTGSSYASPIVAGAAALVKDVYPNLSAVQMMEVLRVTTDDIYAVGNNSAYEGKLGSGRLNVYKALSADTLRSIRATDVTYSGEYTDYIFFGDSIKVNFDLTSFLLPVTEGTLNFSSPSPFIHFSQEALALAFNDSMQTKSFALENIFIDPKTPPETLIPVRMNFKEGSYTDFQYFTIQTSPDYLNLDNGQTAVTLSGNGNLAYSADNYINGIGLTWQNKSLLDQLGFIVGNAKDSISDNATNKLGLMTRDNDFLVDEHIRFYKNEHADFFASNRFYDDGILGLKIEQRAFSFLDTDLDDGIILEYRISNKENDSIKNLSAGLYADWDMGIGQMGKALFDEISGIAYANSGDTLFPGMKIFGQLNPIIQSLDLASNDGNSMDIGWDFTDSVKHQLLSQSYFDSAGFAGTVGNDIAQLSAIEKVNLGAFGSIKIAFILAAGNTYDELKNNIKSLELKYQDILNNPPLLESFISCNGASLAIDPVSGTNFKYYKDPLGKQLIATGDTLQTGIISSDTVFYAQNIDSLVAADMTRIEIHLIEKVTQFSMSTDTLYLDHPSVNTISFTDESYNPKAWTWDFGNGSSASIQNPKINFTKAGTFQVTLEVQTGQGCIDEEIKTLVVANRPALPLIENQFVCPDGSVSLAASNGDSIAVYTSSSIKTALFKGLIFDVETVAEDISFYISNIEGPFESLRKKVDISILAPQAMLSYEINKDTETNAVRVFNQSSDYQLVEWFVDGLAAGQSDTLTFDLTKTSYEVKVKITSALGCEDSVTQTLQFQSSPKPTLTFSQPCLGENLTLKPQNGSVFGFYRNEELTDLILKGKELELVEVNSDSSIYIVGLDSGLPSDPLKVDIQPIQFSFAISANPEVLELKNSKTAVFSTTSANISQWEWYVGDQYVSALGEVNLLLNEVGFHQILLNAVSIDGCTHSDTLEYEVVQEVIIPLNIQSSNKITISPNPTRGRLYISGLNQSGSLIVRDLSGKAVVQLDLQAVDHQEIDLSNYKSGIYLLTLKSGDTLISERVILK